MTRPSQSLLLLEVTTCLSLVAILTGLGLYRDRYTELRYALSQTVPNARRTTIQDRLIGTKIHVRSLPGNAAYRPEPGQRLVLWILDLDRCHSCVGSLTPWIKLESLTDHAFLLLIVGKPSPPLQTQLRVLRRTAVVHLSRDDVVSSLGHLLPNTKIFLDPEGIALLVDSREADRLCNWSFEGQLAALSGVSSGAEVRMLAPD